MKRYLLVLLSIMMITGCQAKEVEMPSDTPVVEKESSKEDQIVTQANEYLQHTSIKINENTDIGMVFREIKDVEFRLISVHSEEDDNEYVSFIVYIKNDKVDIMPLENIEFKLTEFNVEEIKNGFAIGVAGTNDNNEKTIVTYYIDNGILKPLQLSNLDLQNENYIIDDNILTFNNELNLEVYDGPLGVLFRVDNSTEHLYSLVCDYGSDRYNQVQYYINLDTGIAERYVRKWYYRDYEWGSDNQGFIYYNEESFDKSVADILVKESKMIQTKSWRVPLPDDYSILGWSSGDLNGDETLDIAVAIERIPGLSNVDRQLYILVSNQDGSFSVVEDAHKLIPGSEEGGVFGDPYTGASIKDGKLTVEVYGGSSDRWGWTETYDYIESRLKLTSSTTVNHSTHSGCGTTVVTDYDKKIKSRLTYSFNDEYNNLLLGSEEFTIDVDKYLDEVMPDTTNKYCYVSQSNDEYLPSLYRIPYGEQYWIGELDVSAKDVLEFVKLNKYPELSKEKFTSTKEVIDNYSKVLLYTIPSYYYRDDNVKLWYDGIEPMTDDLTHVVWAYDSKTNVSTEYFVKKTSDGFNIEKGYEYGSN